MFTDVDVSVIGAGPYGLSMAAHLKGVGRDVQVFGTPMSFWKSMPQGMLLRSYPQASNLSDPWRAYTLGAYGRLTGREITTPVPLRLFIDYGTWFAERAVGIIDARQVTSLTREGRRFRLTLDDGETVSARRVVVAAGVAPFTWVPPMFAALPPELATHAWQHQSFAHFAGHEVAVVGAGQSGLETAALLLEAGAASVKVLVRGPRVHWLRFGSTSRLHAALHSRFNPARQILYPASDIGPPGINFLVDQPTLFRLLPSSLQGRVARRAIRPAGAGWLPERLGKATITTNVAVRQLRPTGSRLRLELSDGTSPEVDHLFLATGYRVDIARYAFLEPLIPEIRRDNGYPQLTPRFQTSVPGLYIVGAPAAKAFGPLQRFVAGTRYTAERAVPDFT